MPTSNEPTSINILQNRSKQIKKKKAQNNGVQMQR